MILIPILLLVAVSIYWAVRQERRAEQHFLDRHQPPGQMVDLGGYRLHLISQGEKRPGKPTVVFISGHGDWSRCWQKVLPEIACRARVIAYDRSGLGWSDSNPKASVPAWAVNDLHLLLEKTGESSPYLLVGHSMGAPLARLFYHQYPEQVVGMVWVDPAHENMAAFIPLWRMGYRSLLPVMRVGKYLAQLGLVRRLGSRYILAGYSSREEPAEQMILLEHTVTPRFFQALIDDTIMLSTQRHWMGQPRSLGSLPVISIEAQYTTERPFAYSKKNWDRFLAGWRAMQVDLRHLSSNLRWEHADSGHNVMYEKPQIVIRAVYELLSRIEKSAP